ncbi:MAG: MerR family transcriptional regulator [Alistipes sp.]|nr:MerR family transcriptional regulator [Alistipes sp.]
MAEKIYYSMGEVAEMFDVNQSLLRHWESKFDCLRPHKNKRGNRMFSAEDIEKLKQIYHLVKERGMTLEGARKVMRGASGKELARDTKLLERLQRIRAALVEVREELKAGDDEQIVSSVGAELREADDVTDTATILQDEPEKIAEVTVVETQQDNAENSQPVVEESHFAPEQAVAEDAEPSNEVNEPNVADDAATVAEQPAKKRVRRRKKSDDDNKELFPFYEQSLF